MELRDPFSWRNDLWRRSFRWRHRGNGRRCSSTMLRRPGTISFPSHFMPPDGGGRLSSSLAERIDMEFGGLCPIQPSLLIEGRHSPLQHSCWPCGQLHRKAGILGVCQRQFPRGRPPTSQNGRVIYRVAYRKIDGEGDFARCDCKPRASRG
jgi:hypothetical protein